MDIDQEVDPAWPLEDDRTGRGTTGQASAVFRERTHTVRSRRNAVSNRRRLSANSFEDLDSDSSRGLIADAMEDLARDGARFNQDSSSEWRIESTDDGGATTSSPPSPSAAAASVPLNAEDTPLSPSSMQKYKDADNDDLIKSSAVALSTDDSVEIETPGVSGLEKTSLGVSHAAASDSRKIHQVPTIQNNLETDLQRMNRSFGLPVRKFPVGGVVPKTLDADPTGATAAPSVKQQPVKFNRHGNSFDEKLVTKVNVLMCYNSCPATGIMATPAPAEEENISTKSVVTGSDVVFVGPVKTLIKQRTEASVLPESENQAQARSESLTRNDVKEQLKRFRARDSVAEQISKSKPTSSLHRANLITTTSSDKETAALSMSANKILSGPHVITGSTNKTVGTPQPCTNRDESNNRHRACDDSGWTSHLHSATPTKTGDECRIRSNQSGIKRRSSYNQSGNGDR